MMFMSGASSQLPGRGKLMMLAFNIFVQA